MERNYNKKRVNLFFDFDENGDLIENSRFCGVTYFDETGYKNEKDGREPVIALSYEDMTNDQKLVFDNIISSYINLKNQ